jgi:hypothetical protein
MGAWTVFKWTSPSKLMSSIGVSGKLIDYSSVATHAAPGDQAGGIIAGLLRPCV